jgi:4-diphosphocytidyl-2-C-methyl-D-erythritol kinase
VVEPGGRIVCWRGHAPAKLNLTLRVFGQRPDGYHELETVMAAIDWVDDIELELIPGGRGEIRMELLGDVPEGLVSGPENLAWMAAQRFLEGTGWSGAIGIRLTKRIPAGAGLGGGSSDAGAVLRGLSAATGLELDRSVLLEMAQAIGSDVPFFITDNSAAVCRGRGELIEGCANGLEGMPVVVVYPGFGSSTRAAYAGFKKPLSPPAWNPTIFLDFLKKGSLRQVADYLTNDLAGPVTAKFPFLELVREALIEGGALGASMTGSGSAFFGLFADELVAEGVSRDLRGRLGPAARVHCGRFSDSGVWRGSCDGDHRCGGA